AHGCTANAQITLTQNNPVSVSLVSSTRPSCAGGSNGSATIAASGGTGPYTVVWSNTQTGLTASGLAAGVYIATVTDANGCTATLSVTITQPLAMTAAATHTNVSCKFGNNGMASANANGGTFPYSYAWSNGGSGQNSNNLTAGTYTVTVTDANGCQATASTIVSEPASALVGFINTSAALCNGAANGQV